MKYSIRVSHVNPEGANPKVIASELVALVLKGVVPERAAVGRMAQILTEGRGPDPTAMSLGRATKKLIDGSVTYHFERAKEAKREKRVEESRPC